MLCVNRYEKHANWLLGRSYQETENILDAVENVTRTTSSWTLHVKSRHVLVNLINPISVWFLFHIFIYVILKMKHKQ